MEQLRLSLDEANGGVAIIGADRSSQGLRERVCVDALLQFGPVGEAVFARDDELSVTEPKRCGRHRGIVGVVIFWMAATYAVEGIAFAVAPSLKEFARFALRNIEMGSFR
jgi:hypothetical protein